MRPRVVLLLGLDYVWMGHGALVVSCTRRKNPGFNYTVMNILLTDEASDHNISGSNSRCFFDFPFPGAVSVHHRIRGLYWGLEIDCTII